MTTLRIELLAVGILATGVFLLAAQDSAVRKPSLDALVTRAGAYWGLLAKGEKSRALEYVRSQSRDNYLNRQNPAFSEPRVTDLELSQNPVEVWVTVKVKRVLPLIPTPVDWPVKEKWVFEGGKWLVVITISPDKFARVTGTEPKVPATSSEEDAKKLQAIREALHFENSKVDLGTVRQGERVPIELKYRLTGSEAMIWKLTGAPRGLTRTDSSGRDLKPGEGQKIELILQTQELDGKISGTFTILAVSAGQEVPYEFSIHGYVYAPVSTSPRPVRFLKGESAKEVVVRNNSKSAIQVVSAKAVGFDVEGLPQTIAPGAECRLAVKPTFRSYGTNHGAEITLRFAEPADGVQSVAFPVIANFEPQKAWQRPFYEKPLPAPKTPR
jgi:hypothetical protein